MKKLTYKDIFNLEEVIEVFVKTKEIGENMYKMLNTWLRRKCISKLAFMKMEIKGYEEREREIGRKMHGEQLSRF